MATVVTIALGVEFTPPPPPFLQSVLDSTMCDKVCIFDHV